MILKYRVLHAQIVASSREAELEGETVTITTNRCIVELEAVDHAGGTLTLRLPATELPAWPEGAVIPFTSGEPVIEDEA